AVAPIFAAVVLALRACVVDAKTTLTLAPVQAYRSEPADPRLDAGTCDGDRVERSQAAQFALGAHAVAGARRADAVHTIRARALIGSLAGCTRRPIQQHDRRSGADARRDLRPELGHDRARATLLAEDETYTLVPVGRRDLERQPIPVAHRQLLAEVDRSIVQ